ncbi:MAG: permease [Caldilineaceae bacterium]|nr:permease [Caldilineaceae bacterium]
MNRSDSVVQTGAPADATAAMERQKRPLSRRLVIALLLLLAISVIGSELWRSPQSQFFLRDRAQTFVTIFLGIFIEAVPFLLAGSLVGGFIHIFVSQERLEKFIPHNRVLAPLSGAALGLLFPVCECGVVPVTRRLYGKGLPVSVGVAFLLAAPVINPVVIASTYAAFGWGPVLWGRMIFSLLIAFVIGLLFQFATPTEVLRPEVLLERGDVHEVHGPWTNRIRAALNTAGDDFLDMARYLIAGSLLAAAMQTLVDQSLLLAIGQGPIISVFAMQVLAFVLSVCSTVDAFLALAFAGTFTTGSIVAFLTFGPMVDIKSSLMFLGVFNAASCCI